MRIESSLMLTSGSNGSDGKRGNIIIGYNDATIMKGQVIDVNAEGFCFKFFSEKSVEILGQQSLIYTVGLLTYRWSHTSIKGSKNPVSGVLVHYLGNQKQD